LLCVQPPKAAWVPAIADGSIILARRKNKSAWHALDSHRAQR